MAITVPGKDGNSEGNGSNVTLTFSDYSYTALENDIVFLIGGFASETVGPRGAVTSGYTLVSSYDGHTTNKNNFGIWYKVMGSTPDTSVVGYGSGNAKDSVAYMFYAVRGADTSTIFDNTSTTAGPTSSTNPNPPSIETLTANSLVIVAAGNVVADGSPGVPSGYGDNTNISYADTNPFSVAVASKTIASPATEDPGAWSTWSSGVWYAITMAIKAPSTSAIKTIGGLAKASVKTVGGLAIANVKTIGGLA